MNEPKYAKGQEGSYSEGYSNGYEAGLRDGKKPALTAKDPLDEIFLDNFNRSALRKINARQRAHERDINFAEERKERELKKESAKHG